jgi:hypothetical protein
MEVTLEACKEMHIGHHERLLLLFSFNKTCSSPQVVGELPSVKFYEYSFSVLSLLHGHRRTRQVY